MTAAERERLLAFVARMNVSIDRFKAIMSTPPTCSECGRPWFDRAERWRSYLTVDDEAAIYCPACAREEFGDG